MIEIKLSQGAKPGHGGLLPGPKVRAQAFRAVQYCVSFSSRGAHAVK